MPMEYVFLYSFWAFLLLDFLFYNGFWDFGFKHIGNGSNMCICD
ncbi:hypothetical protein SLEP1_g42947 [Rubroshorea leprosula]|uniref:ATP synthase F0 subunit 8 n=1 Tax=Rubroshorea leprosula TaxID=152421 RepID=A0AAV5LCE2_9ROSI|nr:hypothetical protein SLEP1_g42947 [Rubroshorea leprosula]